MSPSGMRPAVSRSAGFTLIETMVVVIIIAILAAVAGPNLSQFINSQKVKNSASDLYNALVRARSEAIKRNSAVTMMPAGASWADGWATNGTTVDGDSETIETHPAVINLTLTGPASLTFTYEGRLIAASAPSFSLSDPSGDTRRCVMVDLSGRPAIKKTGC